MPPPMRLMPLLLFATLAVVPSRVVGETIATIYRGATVVEGTGSLPKADMAIVTRGERIEAIVATTALAKSMIANGRVVDVQGLYAIPGLIDSHVHLATPPERKYALAQLRRDLYSGITTVRDMAGDTRFWPISHAQPGRGKSNRPTFISPR